MKHVSKCKSAVYLHQLWAALKGVLINKTPLQNHDSTKEEGKGSKGKQGLCQTARMHLLLKFALLQSAISLAKDRIEWNKNRHSKFCYPHREQNGERILIHIPFNSSCNISIDCQAEKGIAQFQHVRTQISQCPFDNSAQFLRILA